MSPSASRSNLPHVKSVESDKDFPIFNTFNMSPSASRSNLPYVKSVESDKAFPIFNTFNMSPSASRSNLPHVKSVESDKDFHIFNTFNMSPSASRWPDDIDTLTALLRIRIFLDDTDFPLPGIDYRYITRTAFAHYYPLALGEPTHPQSASSPSAPRSNLPHVKSVESDKAFPIFNTFNMSPSAPRPNLPHVKSVESDKAFPIFNTFNMSPCNMSPCNMSPCNMSPSASRSSVSPCLRGASELFLLAECLPSLLHRRVTTLDPSLILRTLLARLAATTDPDARHLLTAAILTLSS